MIFNSILDQQNNEFYFTYNLLKNLQANQTLLKGLFEYLETYQTNLFINIALVDLDITIDDSDYLSQIVTYQFVIVEVYLQKTQKSKVVQQQKMLLSLRFNPQTGQT